MFIRITTILISRFLLDLQHANKQDVQLGTDDHQPSSWASTATTEGSLTFARALGSLSSTIDPRAGANLDIWDEYE